MNAITDCYELIRNLLSLRSRGNYCGTLKDADVRVDLIVGKRPTSLLLNKYSAKTALQFYSMCVHIPSEKCSDI